MITVFEAGANISGEDGVKGECVGVKKLVGRVERGIGRRLLINSSR
jgi:hypothetical protein